MINRGLVNTKAEAVGRVTIVLSKTVVAKRMSFNPDLIFVLPSLLLVRAIHVLTGQF